MHKPIDHLRARLAEKSAIIVPGAGNALAARIIGDLGFEAVYLSGAGLTNTLLGLPDLAFVSLPEVVQNTAAISEVVDLPLIVDACCTRMLHSRRRSRVCRMRSANCGGTGRSARAARSPRSRNGSGWSTNRCSTNSISVTVRRGSVTARAICLRFVSPKIHTRGAPPPWR